MKVASYIIAFCALSLTSIGRDVAPAPKAATSSPENATEELCAKLIKEAQEIDALLRKIDSRSSADHTAPLLSAHRIRMRGYLAELEQMPFDAETTLVITTQMTALTHITQGYMPLIQNLLNSDSFGSSALAEQLNKLVEVENFADDEDDTPEAPYAPMYERMLCLLGDALYMLRKAQDTATARDASSVLRDVMQEHAKLLADIAELKKLEPPDKASVSDDNLMYLRGELDKEFRRLKSARFYGDPDLPVILPRYIKSFK